MSKTATGVTKPGSLTQAFMRAAARDPDGGLAFMLMSAFGITLSMLMTIADEMLREKSTAAIMMCLTASLQIRNHVVFVGRDYGGIRSRWPQLIIEGTRPLTDIYNFGGLRALGHIFSHLTKDLLGSKILKKAGSCITGAGVTESEAGKINKETADGWSVEDKQAWAVHVMPDATQGFLDALVAGVPAKSTAFAAILRSDPESRPAAPVITAARPGSTTAPATIA